MTVFRKQELDSDYPVPSGSVEVLWGRGNMAIQCIEGTLRLTHGQLKYLGLGVLKKTSHRTVSQRDWIELLGKTAKLVGGRITHTDSTLSEE